MSPMAGRVNLAPVRQKRLRTWVRSLPMSLSVMTVHVLVQADLKGNDFGGCSIRIATLTLLLPTLDAGSRDWCVARVVGA